MEQLITKHETIKDPEKVARVVQDAYKMYGRFLDDIEEPALLADPLCLECPIVGCSAGVREMTGYHLDHLLGQNCRLLLKGVPANAISKSARKNIKDYCNMCQVRGLSGISETASVQPNTRSDGTHFVNFFLLGLCKVQHRIFILGVQMHLGEGLFVRLSRADNRQAMEQTRNTFKRIRDLLRENAPVVERAEADAIIGYERQVSLDAEFKFFSERLQDHCLLTNNGYTAIRREPSDLGVNCLVFGDQPLRRLDERGMLGFTVHVDAVTEAFGGLPVLGFTRRKPSDDPDLYPAVARCLGRSVLIGAAGEAFARDQPNHYKMGFKPPPGNEIQVWALQPDLPPHKRTAPVQIEVGDLLKCLYLPEGRIQLLHNGYKILDFDVERPLQDEADYYAVVDVCFSAASLTIVPLLTERAEYMADQPAPGDAFGLDGQQFKRETSYAMDNTEAVAQLNSHTISCPQGSPNSRSSSCKQSFPRRPDVSSTPSTAPSCSADATAHSNRRCMELDARLKTTVNEAIVKNSMQQAISKCKFMVTVVDPRGADCPLLAASYDFETLTGFHWREILQEDHVCVMDPGDVRDLRVARETGAPFTAVLSKRQRSGECNRSLLELRGLTVARDTRTGEDVWLLIGVQEDVTGLAQDEIPEDNVGRVRSFANAVRAAIAVELGRMARESLEESPETSPRRVDSSEGVRTPWSLLDKPVWRTGPPLGRRRFRASCAKGWANHSAEPDAVRESKDILVRRCRSAAAEPSSLHRDWSQLFAALPILVVSMALLTAWRRRATV